MGNKPGTHINVLLMGLDGAGKTQLLYRMKLKTQTEFSTTTGFNYEAVQIPNSKTMLHVWDLAGSSMLRRFSRFYYESLRVDILMFVCNLDQKSRLKEASELYKFLCNEERLRKVIRLVILNKDDEKPEAERLKQSEVVTAFGIDPNSKLTRVIQVNAATGAGLDDIYLEIVNCFV